MVNPQKIDWRSIPRVKNLGEQLQKRVKKVRESLLFNQKMVYLQKLKKTLKKWLTSGRRSLECASPDQGG
jgi:hypothetical protein